MPTNNAIYQSQYSISCLLSRSQDLAEGHVFAVKKVLDSPNYGCKAVNLGTGAQRAVPFIDDACVFCACFVVRSRSAAMWLQGRQPGCRRAEAFPFNSLTSVAIGSKFVLDRRSRA